MLFPFDGSCVCASSVYVREAARGEARHGKAFFHILYSLLFALLQMRERPIILNEAYDPVPPPKKMTHHSELQSLL